MSRDTTRPGDFTRFGTIPQYYDGEAIRLKGLEENFVGDPKSPAILPVVEVWNPDTLTWEEAPEMGFEAYYRSLFLHPGLPHGMAERVGLDESNGLNGYVMDESLFDSVMEENDAGVERPGSTTPDEPCISWVSRIRKFLSA